MKRIFLLLIIIIFAQILTAQPEARKYKFIAQIEKELKEQKLMPIRAAWEYSYIGEYWHTIEMDDLDIQVRQESYLEQENLSLEELKAFEQYKPESALHYIAQRAQNEQIIILNEAHPKPLHRVFAEQLLDSLYAAGFRYLGLEALQMSFSDTTRIIEMDTFLNKRGYPYSSPITGTYTCEPQFGNLIRTAIQKGFHVFGYEAMGFQRKQMSRDSAQALNVQRILLNNPKAKILLFCGYSHLLEQPQPCPKDNPDCKQLLWMAYHLKNLTGIDPFTINQDILTERLATSESPYFKIINADQPSVFINKNGKVFNGLENLDLYDILIYHPRTKYIKGRPDWLLRNGKFKYYQLNKSEITINCPCQVRAYDAHESEAATPIDMMEWRTKDEEKALVLPPGKYNIVIENIARELQRLKIEVK
ncbi:MAG: hypothetical protein SFU99_16135 [Saprospiraceae bacterium]|nr:hypothetical protein [Saprospiraceae bacterium]